MSDGTRAAIRRFKYLEIALEESFEKLGQALTEADGETVRISEDDIMKAMGNLKDAAGVARVLRLFLTDVVGT